MKTAKTTISAKPGATQARPAAPPPKSPPQAKENASNALELIENCKFKIRTVEDAALLTRFACTIFKDPARIKPGLYELLLNAVEHGCLGVGHELKARLLANRTWEAEVARRQSLPENRQKSVDVVIARRPAGLFVIITDPGKGFDWKGWIALDPARGAATHGHGIAHARSISFDSITYNAEGNQVVAFSKDGPDIDW